MTAPLAVIDQLLADHQEFFTFGRAIESILRMPPPRQDLRQLRELVAAFKRRLDEHAKLEDDVFYPAVRAVIDRGSVLTPAFMNHLDNEHKTADRHMARLIEQVNAPRPTLGWGQTFAIFSVGLRAHMRREEAELFPEARRLLT